MDETRPPEPQPSIQGRLRRARESLAAVKGEKTPAELTSADVHLNAMTAAVRLMIAAEFRAVLSYRGAILRHCLIPFRHRSELTMEGNLAMDLAVAELRSIERIARRNMARTAPMNLRVWFLKIFRRISSPRFSLGLALFSLMSPEATPDLAPVGGPTRLWPVDADETHFIGEHDPQAAAASGGRAPGFPHRIWKGAFLKAFQAAMSRLG